MAIEDELRQASDRFYAALNESFRGNTAPMNAAWSRGSAVSTMLPSGGRQIGWDQVRPTWEQLAPEASASTGLAEITVSDLVVLPITDDVAYTLGTEQIQGNAGGQPISLSLRATNIYRREGGEWKMVHRHGDALRR